MSVETFPFGISAETYSAEIVRRAMNLLFARNAAGGIGTVGGGVVGGYDGSAGTDLVMSAPGSGLSVNVAAGECLVPGSASFATTVSGYYFRNTATLNLPISTANPSNPRIDLVCATINDATYHGAVNSGVLQVVTGTPSSGANLTNLTGAAALPDASLLIGYVLVPAAATNITSGDLGDHRSGLTMGLNAAVSPGSVLGYVTFNPSSGVDYTVTSSQVVDATNLGVTFTAPPSGIVEFSFEAEMNCAGTTAGLVVRLWDITAGAVLSSVYDEIMLATTVSTASQGRCRYSAIVTGLTPGSSHHWGPGSVLLGSSGANIYVGQSLTAGPAIVKVCAL